jgi:hypothetical protein
MQQPLARNEPGIGRKSPKVKEFETASSRRFVTAMRFLRRLSRDTHNMLGQALVGGKALGNYQPHVAPRNELDRRKSSCPSHAR